MLPFTVCVAWLTILRCRAKRSADFSRSVEYSFGRSKTNLFDSSAVQKDRLLTLDTQYLAIANQYYIAGQSATFTSSVPVSGNLFHPGIEMLLKFLLVKNQYSADSARKEFRHDLNAFWSEVTSSVKKQLWRRLTN
jgi:hypothetical protein